MPTQVFAYFMGVQNPRDIGQENMTARRAAIILNDANCATMRRCGHRLQHHPFEGLRA